VQRFPGARKGIPDMTPLRSLARALFVLAATLACLAAPARAADADGFLELDEAFRASVVRLAGDRLAVQFEIAPGHYLYRDRMSVAAAGNGPAIDEAVRPQGEMKDDPSFGRVAIYHDRVAVPVKLAAAGEALVAVDYQGCSEKGLCYPPTTKTFRVAATAGAAGVLVDDVPAAAPTDAAPAAKAGAAPAAEQSETAGIASILSSGSFLGIVATFFGFGLLLALTPCVFPMLPILSGIIVGSGERLSKSRALTLSVAYVLGMAITYAAAGVAAGLSGTLLSNALQNAWVLGAFGLVFVVLSLSMFGLYDLQLPNALQSKLNGAANNMQGGRLASVFIMGALSALIVGPCVAAPLAGALLYISNTGDGWLGGAALFAMALGMGVPLVIVGTSAGALLPRAGKWMEGVKKAFGIALLGVAVWIVSPVMPPMAATLAIAAVLVITAVFTHALEPLPASAGPVLRFGKAAGLMCLFTAAALVFSAFGVGPGIETAKAGGAARVAADAPQFKRVATAADFERELAAATGKPVVVDFYADWCVSCKEMEHNTLRDPRVAAKLKEATLLQVDVTKTTADSKKMLARFGLFGPPGIVVFDRTGREIESARVVGFKAPEPFLARIQVAFGG
jgi:thiol:disulfide interchange protein DsbD